MRVWFVSFFVVFCLIFAFCFFAFSNVSFVSLVKGNLVSPIPNLFNVFSQKKKVVGQIWLPFVEKSFGSEKEALEVSSEGALVYDLTSEQTLYEKDAKKRLPMASLTKIMTAIVALENKKENDRYVATWENLVGEDSMGITPGEIFTLKELLLGLILRSGNDAAEVLASNYPSGRDTFVFEMNEKVQALGLTNTHFSNPSGLQGDGMQYTTAYDLLVMSKYALDNFPQFVEVSSTFETIIPANTYHKEFYLQNETNLISSYPGVKGIKTGFTPEAGLCLVTYLDYGGHRIIAILLNSQNRRQEMKDLLDYSLRRLGTKPPTHE